MQLLSSELAAWLYLRRHDSSHSMRLEVVGKLVERKAGVNWSVVQG